MQLSNVSIKFASEDFSYLFLRDARNELKNFFNHFMFMIYIVRALTKMSESEIFFCAIAKLAFILIVISVQGSTTYNFERVAGFLSLIHP